MQTCSECNGRRCPTCDYTGRITEVLYERVCMPCGGGGYVGRRLCGTCKGAGRVHRWIPA